MNSFLLYSGILSIIMAGILLITCILFLVAGIIAVRRGGGIGAKFTLLGGALGTACIAIIGVVSLTVLREYQDEIVRMQQISTPPTVTSSASPSALPTPPSPPMSVPPRPPAPPAMVQYLPLFAVGGLLSLLLGALGILFLSITVRTPDRT